MFNQVNTANRLRHFVRGRVIVFTTSPNIEFVDKNLTTSYPLYSLPRMPPGFGISFCVELDGYLTFDSNTEVRITQEVKLFEQVHYDPTAFALVRVLDETSLSYTFPTDSAGATVFSPFHAQAANQA